MIDVKKQHEWLKEYIQDDPDNLGTDIETRTFNALEVEMIMNIYSDTLLKERIPMIQGAELAEFRKFIFKQVNDKSFVDKFNYYFDNYLEQE